jgi:hypothetical protein
MLRSEYFLESHAPGLAISASIATDFRISVFQCFSSVAEEALMTNS